MSKYTIELRKICEISSREEVESWFKDYDLSSYLTNEQIETINKFGVWNKDKLAKKIVDHYFMREIAFETIPLFIHYAKTTMNEIMEKQSQRIYSFSINYDPLINVDYTETFSRTLHGSSESNSESNLEGNSNGNSLNINSDTPQGQISKENILNGDYATSTSANETNSNDISKSNGFSSGESDSNEFYSKNIKGNSGVSATAQKMIEQYRNNIIQIDNDIIYELKDLFFNLY